jgi:glucose-1-phosphate cytidylyltransferase
MKVVLFCGGLGTRLRDYSESIPKPLVNIGYRPILWHVMKYYAHHGHKDFILCLGYKADKIKEYFLNYNEHVSNDFVLTQGGKNIELLRSDIHDWRITFVDTGLKSNIGKRLKLVEKYLDGDEYFLANYSDGLTDLPLNSMIEDFKKTNSIGSFLCAPPSQTFHVVTMNDQGLVESIRYVRDAGIRVNAGYFVFRRELFDHINMGEELVEQPFQRLIAKGLLRGYRYDRFWAMDTFKEQQELSDLYNEGRAPWELWRSNGEATTATSPRLEAR